MGFLAQYCLLLYYLITTPRFFPPPHCTTTNCGFSKASNVRHIRQALWLCILFNGGAAWLPPILLSKVGRGVVLSGPAARAFSPSGRCFLLGHAARAFSPSGRCSLLGLRPGLFRPSGVLPPAGNFLLAQKVPQKRLPPVALRGSSPHSQPSWGFPQLRPSARVAGPRAKYGACQQCRLRPPRKICLARNPPPSRSETASKNTLHLQPSWGFPHLSPSARVAGHCAKYEGCQHCSLHSTSCLRHEAFKQPICQLCIVSCQFTS